MKKLPKPKIAGSLLEKYYHLDLFEVDLFVLVGDPTLIENWARKTLRGERLNEFLAMMHEKKIFSRGTMYPMGGGGSVIWLKAGESDKYLVHEIVHAVTHILRERATPVCDETDELLCYLVQLLYEKFS